MPNEGHAKLIELKERHSKEIKRLERQISCAERLPLTPDSICHQRDEVWVTYRGPDKDAEGRTIYGERTMSMSDAMYVFRTYRQWEHADGIEECEHWKSGCISTQPAELTAKSYKEQGEMIGAHDVELRLERAEYGSRDEISFHVKDKRDGQWYRVILHVRQSVQPKCDARYSNRSDGICIYRKYSCPDGTKIPEVHAMRKWSFGSGTREREEGCHISLYFCQDEFEVWGEQEKQKEMERNAANR